MQKLIVLTFLVALAACSPKEEADLLLYNGTVYLVDDSFGQVEALVLNEGKVVATGSADQLRHTYSFQEERDLEGKFVFPGLIDAHCHVRGYAQALMTADLSSSKSEKEMLTLLANWYEEKKAQGFTPDRIQGWGWDQNSWPGKAMPTKSGLDSLFPNIPVVLRRIDGHAVLVNTAALEADEVCCPENLEGGEIVMENGEPTGVLIDNAVDLVKKWEASDEQMTNALIKAEQDFLAHGLTGLHDAGLPPEGWQKIRQLVNSGDFRIPISVMASDLEANFIYLTENGPIEEDRFWLRSVKFYSDGALGSRGALLLEPYSDAPHQHGLPVSSYEHMDEFFDVALKYNLQVCVHAIGDSANRTVLNLFASKLEKGNDRRWRVEHAQVLNPADRHWFGDYSILPSVQPTHATSDSDWAEERLGAERMSSAYAYKSLRKQLGIIPLGTDFPVEDINPLKTFYAAVARKDFAGEIQESYLPDEALTREEALRGMTIDAAFAQFREKETGSLEAGKWADFIILDTDLMTCEESDIPQTQVLSTWIRGEELFSNKN